MKTNVLMKWFACQSVLLFGAMTSAFAVSAPVVSPLGSFSGMIPAPSRLAVATGGHLLCSDSQAGRVISFDAFGHPCVAKYGLLAPLGIAVDGGGNIYLAEMQSGSVSVFDSDWNLLGKLGAGNGEFQYPNFIALDPTPGSSLVFVSDSYANQIRAYTNGSLAFAFGTPGTNTTQFDFPAGLFATTNELFVVDQRNERVQVFDHAGTYLRKFTLVTKVGTGMLGANAGGRSEGITGDAAGRIYVADTFQCFIRVFSRQGTYLTRIGSIGEAVGQLRSPTDLALDGYGRLFASSMNNSRVEVYGIDSFVSVVATPADNPLAAGANFSLAVVSSGLGAFSSQWIKDGTNLVDGGTISGSTSSVLNIAGLATGDAGTYSVSIVSTAGVFVCTTDPLFVMIPPSIVTQPVGGQFAQGSTVYFSATAQGSSVSYQWTFNNEPIAGEMDSTLRLAAVTPGMAGSYAVIVQNLVGKITSEPAVLSVVTPPVITHHPTDQTIVEGETATFFSLADGAGVTYQWKNAGGDVPGANFNAVQIPSAPASAAGAYYVVAENIAGAVTSSVANLNILVPPVFNIVQAAAVLADGTIQLSLFGDSGYLFALDASADLQDWTKLGDVVGQTNAIPVIDLDSTNQPQRFYRLRWNH